MILEIVFGIIIAVLIIRFWPVVISLIVLGVAATVVLGAIALVVAW